MESATYLKTFFEEKDLKVEIYEIQHNGWTHIIESMFIIELLVDHACPAEQDEAAKIIRAIDFANGDIHHFLTHLANRFVNANY